MNEWMSAGASLLSIYKNIGRLFTYRYVSIYLQPQVSILYETQIQIRPWIYLRVHSAILQDSRNVNMVIRETKLQLLVQYRDSVIGRVDLKRFCK